MFVLVTGFSNIFRLELPEKISGNYQVLGYNNLVIATISAYNQKWLISSVNNCKLYKDGKVISSTIYENNTSYILEDVANNYKYKLFIYNFNAQYTTYEIKSNTITIGPSGCDINYQSPDMKTTTINYNETNIYVTTEGKNVYVNDRLIKRKNVQHGDIIFIDGLKLIPYSNRIIISSLTEIEPQINENKFTKIAFDNAKGSNEDIMNMEVERGLYDGDELFSRAPRFKTIYENVNIKITPPPSREMGSTKPSILTAGPRVTTLLTTSVTMFSTVAMSISSGNMTAVIPMLIVCGLTMASSLLWPAISSKYTKKEKRINEANRIKNYTNYLKRKEQEIINEHSKEKQVLLENNVSLEECQQIIYSKKRSLWERDIAQPDFLNVRLGIGTIPSTSIINYEESDFSTDDDYMVKLLKEMIERNRYLEDVPECITLTKSIISAIIGTQVLTQKFINSVLLQLITFQSFLDLKIVIITNEKNAPNWEYCDILPHCWDNQRTFRYISTNISEANLVSTELSRIFNSRMEQFKQENKDESNKKNSATIENGKDKSKAFLYADYPPYYLIIVDDLEIAKHIEIYNDVVNSKNNIGFSLLIRNDRISNLPGKCSTFINIDENMSGLFENELVSSKQKQFKADINNTVDMYGCAVQLSNIPCAIPKGSYELPKSISFLDMYGVGNIDQLNSIDRWKSNNPISSLAVPVGIDQNGNTFNMDAHEKAYGPHGLVAGTTGSGKSEWIITYILSLAVNFSPYEVQFVLIDYKGGGLAGSFENKELGIKLPHVVATITNLDKSEVRRAITSIEAELKHRQKSFNAAREKLKVASMDIYKYQDYYRQGLLDEPLSHLFIISDEFAELKSQEPEFLDQLVSTARIGRSLGVHLILATQKPSGVVSEQIWSNSRFKVCLRVQDAADSKDMIQTNDAAYLKTTGAFYLEVGNNELYTLGQSAYSGFKYNPSDVVKKKIDEDIHIIDKTGNEIKTLTNIKIEKDKTDNGEELLNIIKYIDKLGKEENYHPRKLWLDKMPAIIFTDNVKKQYQFKREQFKLNPVIGIYDDPYNQSQNICTLPIYNLGNIAIYGEVGSGKELFLQSLVYSLSSTYTINECNIFILDYGAQILKICEGNPMVGNVINGPAEIDKVEGLFIYLKNKLNERKQLFSNFGGDYNQYIKTSGKTLPSIVLMLNNLSEFIKTESECVDKFFELSEDCTKYGIYIIITSPTTTLGKYTRNIQYNMCLNYSTEETYKEIFPKNFTYPAIGKARGILEKDGIIYEFQTSIPTTEDKLNQTMKNYNQALLNAYKTKVQSIPYIPEFVTKEMLTPYVTNMEKLPIGIRKNTVQPILANFKNTPGKLIFGNNIEYLEDFTKNILLLMSNIKEDSIFMFDHKKTSKDIVPENITYASDGFDEIISNLYIYAKGINDKVTAEQEVDQSLQTYIIIYSLDSFYSALNADSKKYIDAITTMFENVKCIHFIIIDLESSMRNYSRDSLVTYFRNDGVIIGTGINEQVIINIRKLDHGIRRDTTLDDYAVYIENGKGMYFKIVEDVKQMEDEF